MYDVVQSSYITDDNHLSKRERSREKTVALARFPSVDDDEDENADGLLEKIQENNSLDKSN